jgi:hypothetical protein
LNDNRSGVLVNVALRWAIVNSVTLELQGRDLLAKLPSQQGFTRTIAIEVIRKL